MFVCRPISVLTFCLLPGYKTTLGEGIYGSPHFSGIFAFSQIREDLRMFLSASVDSHLPPAQNNHARVAYFGEEYSDPLQIHAIFLGIQFSKYFECLQDAHPFLIF